MKCSRCKLESDIGEAFTVRKRWFGLATNSYCPACWEKISGRNQVFTVAALIASVITLDILMFNRGLGYILIDILIMGLINVFLVAAHESAHAFVGKLLGVRVFAVKLGYGRRLFTRRAFGITWELHEWLTGGSTVMASPPGEGSRGRLFGAILAGPAVHGALLAAAVVLQVFLLALQGWFGVDARLPLHALSLFLYFNLILLIFNLIPTKTEFSAGRAGSDGWHLLNLGFLKPADAEALDQMYYLMEIRDALSRNEYAAADRFIGEGLARFPDLPALHEYQGTALLGQRQFPEAREAYRSVLSSEEAGKPLHRRILLTNIACADVLLRDPNLLPEADRYSKEAYQNMGWDPVVVGTRGAVLVNMGCLEEGIRLLRRSMTGRKDSTGKALDAYHLALAEHRRGNAKESRRYCQLVRKYDPDFFLLDSLEREIREA
jgi:tetratricopeptide (TPR) repeat protein